MSNIEELEMKRDSNRVSESVTRYAGAILLAVGFSADTVMAGAEANGTHGNLKGLFLSSTSAVILGLSSLMTSYSRGRRADVIDAELLHRNTSEEISTEANSEITS